MLVINNFNEKSNYSPSFGALYTKSSKKLLKNLIPSMVYGENFEVAKQAITNLIETGKRNDNLILKIVSNEPFETLSHLDYYAKRQSSIAKKFHLIRPLPFKKDSELETFEAHTSFVNSDEFVPRVNTIIDNYDSMSPKDKMNVLNNKIRTFCKKTKLDLYYMVGDFLTDIFSITEYNDGGYRREWTIITDIKELLKKILPKKKCTYNYEHSEQAKILAEMIETLPTKRSKKRKYSV